MNIKKYTYTIEMIASFKIAVNQFKLKITLIAREKVFHFLNYAGN